MQSDTAWNMYVFRDGGSLVPGSALLDGLVAALSDYLSAANSRNALLNALLRAGELECALCDANSPANAPVAAFTDLLAADLVAHTSGQPRCCAGFDARAVEHLASLTLPETLRISPPEGFAYYALHPLDFADLLERVPLASGAAAVLGIRSIGSTLSAVVAAELRRRGVNAWRTTLRPTGHPYDRRTEFTPDQLRWIGKHRSHSAEFLVVDEGPGMSGSSFLSAGEALLSAGVPRSRIAFLCSRHADVRDLRARDAATRWPGFRAYHVRPTTHVPSDAKIYIGAGNWRSHVFADASQWPASWIHMERLKFLSPDKKRIYKFEGLGRFGIEVHERARLLADGGFAPAPLERVDGFGCYPMVEGEPLCSSAVSAEILERMAQYCAFRGFEFRLSGSPGREMEDMLRFNLQEEFGAELHLDPSPLHTASPVLADGRMLPYEWLRARAGRLLKFDGATHGDDHFFPGPTDIAWDLAGAIVEWDLDREAARFLAERYRHASGDDISRRLPVFVLAYTVFRLGYCKMASAAVRGTGEEERLWKAYLGYRARAQAQLPQAIAA